MRLLRTNSSKTTFEESLVKFKQHLRTRGYPKTVIERSFSGLNFAATPSALTQKKKAKANCDSSSRLPRPQAPAEKPDKLEMFHTSVVEALPVTDQEVRMQTRRDPVLSRVLEFVQSRWEGAEVHPEFIPYAHRGTEMTINHGILMWGSRVVVLTKLRERVLETLHEGHIGMVKMTDIEDVKRPQIIQLVHPCTNGITRPFPGKGFT